jgi:hypothetical protein
MPDSQDTEDCLPLPLCLYTAYLGGSFLLRFEVVFFYSESISRGVVDKGYALTVIVYLFFNVSSSTGRSSPKIGDYERIF